MACENHGDLIRRLAEHDEQLAYNIKVEVKNEP